jgi:hypothetical protein
MKARRIRRHSPMCDCTSWMRHLAQARNPCSRSCLWIPGSRKSAHCLRRDGLTVPVPSTVHQILCRNGRIKPTESAPPNPGHRFEKEAPNLLW